MFKKYTVANWMKDQGIPYTEAAKQYTVGQKLTADQAREIIRMIAQNMGFMEEHPGKHESWTRLGDPYRRVLYKYAFLIEAQRKWGSNWDYALWDALDEEDRIACNDLSNDYFAYKFGMTQRLNEIENSRVTGYKYKL